MALKVLELYSGIGGMHYAVKNIGVQVEVVAAIDINTIANEVYRHNFPHSNLMQRSIEGVTTKDFDKWKSDVLLMSPPCQPFTRVGLQADSADPRTRSFFHVLKLIQSSQNPPNFILVENVKGFENSDTRNALIESLKSCKYQFQEFLLSPNQFGIPNSRLRYFLLAKRHPHRFHFTISEKILERLPRCSADSTSKDESPIAEGEDGKTTQMDEVTDRITELTVDGAVAVSAPSLAETQSRAGDHTTCTSERTMHSEENVRHNMDSQEMTSQRETNCMAVESIEGETELSEETNNEQSDGIKCIGEFIEENNTDFSQYLIVDKILLRFGRLMDIVKPSTQRSCCFTKAYYHYVEGTGSVFQMNSTANTAETFKKFLSLPDDDTEKVSILKQLQLRYFTPREVANLMCFPPEFCFPESTSLKQRYRLLGNSLNVHVVTVLLRDYLLDSLSPM
ncbi:tRNA (cytosine(38)-C(5))-methyltransferase-like [Ptychodera flava]|uniref:tRNA (cytosine(38)-C(5))-methyltransferase-like n=1 Tax=Ptychodera flava TaxID=63121 RepID=UPI00396A878A